MQICEDLAIKILKIVHVESNIFHVTLVEWNSWGSYAVNCFRKHSPWNDSISLRILLGFSIMKVSESLTQETKISLAKVPREKIFFLSLSKTPSLRTVSRPRLHQPPLT